MFENHHSITKEDIKSVFKEWRPVIENQIRKDYSAKKIGKNTAIARQQVLERSEKLMHSILEHGLTVHIVIEWLEIEMKHCNKLAKDKT